MKSREQKKKKSVHIHPQVAMEPDEALKELSDIFKKFQISLGADEGSSRSIESDIDENFPPESSKSFNKEKTIYLYDLQKVLAKELGNSLSVIIRETFEDASEDTDIKQSIKVLVIFYRLLGISALTTQNSTKILKWIYDITNLASFSLCIELSNTIISIMKKLIKVGFLIMKKYQHIDTSRCYNQDEQTFQSMMETLVELKEKQVDSLKYEICRLCERYFPLTAMSLHLTQCQRMHEIKYLQTKIEEKGSELLAFFIKNEEVNSSQIQHFFQQIFVTFDGRNAIFKHKNSLEELKDIIQQLEINTVLELKELKDTLMEYNRYRSKEAKGQTLSDKELKSLKSHRVVSIRGVGFSSTSLDPEGQTLYLSHSEKTINSDNDSYSRGTNLAFVRLKDFQVIKKLGQGAYSEVFLVRKRNTQDLYAMKVIELQDLSSDRMTAFKKEQKIYRSISGSYNVKLYYSFREDNLYFFVLDYGPGGTLKRLLEDQVYFQEKDAKIYLANLVLAVEMLHSIDIIHRDLKPDNIVIDEDGKLILTDFNLCKMIKHQEIEKANSFYGTPDYIAPEVLRGEPATVAIDWFSLGVIAYQMIIGNPPFADMTVQAVFENIRKGQIDWPEVGTQEDQITANCKDFIQQLLHSNPKERLGSHGLTEIKAHPFFEGVNWNNIGQQGYYYVPPPDKDVQQNKALLQYILNRKKKLNPSSSELIGSQGSIVRYDVLKDATNDKIRSRRSSRFKIEKELQELRLTPQLDKRQQSHNNFKSEYSDSVGVSCHNFYKMDSTKETP